MGIPDAMIPSERTAPDMDRPLTLILAVSETMIDVEKNIHKSSKHLQKLS